MKGEEEPSRSITNSPLPSDSNSLLPDSTFNISEKETIRRLRAKGQPIRLFAESDKERRLRLRALELIEEKGSERQGGQNDFKKALEDVENVERELQSKNNKGKRKGEAEQASTGVLDLGLIKSGPDKLYPLIYYALKRTLKEWEEAMDERPGEPFLTRSQRQLALTDAYQSTSNAPRRANWLRRLKCNPQNTLNHSSKLCVREYIIPSSLLISSELTFDVPHRIYPMTC